MNENPPPPKRGVINVIDGGPAAGGSISNTRDVYASQLQVLPKYGKRRQPEKEDVVIPFSNADKKHIVYPHDDALVITMDINGYDVQMILVDGGSAADLVHIEVLKKMGKTEADLSPSTFPLVSFAGAATYPLGIDGFDYSHQAL